MSRLVLQSVCKTFPARTGEVRALDHFSLTIEPGEFLALIGPSGSGKTTLLRLIAGFEQPDAGRISFGERSMIGVSPGDREVAMVFQDHALYPHLRVRENLSFGLKLRNVPRAEISTRIETVSAQLGISELLERRPETLSGGQAQRVALARALVRQPAVLLLDEPFAHLDSHLRFQLRGELARIHRASGATALYVTHDPAEAMALADRIAVLHSGVLQQAASPRELYSWPANKFVAAFITTPPMNFLVGVIKAKSAGLWFVSTDPDSGASVLVGRVAEPHMEKLRPYLDRPVICGVRPESISTSEQNSEPSFAGAVEAVLERIESNGARVWLHARLGSHALIAQGTTECGRLPGEKLALTLDMRAARYFDPGTGRAILQPGSHPGENICCPAAGG
jgi:multiple sugar transport system ATP-binding protein